MKIVQVPMDEAEAEELTRAARDMKVSRADLIRRACRSFLDAAATHRLDAQYEEGYRRMPETGSIGDTSAQLAATMLAAEEWST